MQLLRIILLTLLIGSLAGLGLLGPWGIITGASIAGLVVLIWYNAATDFVLNRIGARRLTEASASNSIQRMFLGDAYKLVQAAGLPRNAFYIVDTPLPIAFSIGSARSGGRVVVTTGLFRVLSRLEISAVIGHELGHIKAGERLATAMEISLSILFSATGLRAVTRVLSFGLLNPAEPTITRMSLRSLGPDTRADAFAVSLCKDVSILASALNKLERGVRSAHWDVMEGVPAIAKLAVVNPRHALVGAHTPEESPMAHRVAEIRRLVLPKAA